jgi:AraC family transcriptional regulator
MGRAAAGRLHEAAADGTKPSSAATAQRSEVPFVDVRTQRRVDALAEARMTVTSRGLGWRGVVAEEGVAGAWDVGPLTVASHYLALNLDPTPLPVLVREPTGDRVEVLPPRGMWFCPAGETFSHRVEHPCRFALVTVAPERFAQWTAPLGEPPALVRRYGVCSAPLEHLLLALVGEAAAGGPSGVAWVDQVGAALATQLAQHFAASGGPALVRGGLSGAARRRLQALWAEGLAEAPSVEAMAAAVGLSPSHFQRAFRETFGCPPWQHVLGLRLEAARRRLLAGEGASVVAAALGFADQSHFTRHFRRRYGVTPGRLARDAAPVAGGGAVG